jgi:hypothetical protein
VPTNAHVSVFAASERNRHWLEQPTTWSIIIIVATFREILYESQEVAAEQAITGGQG